MLARWVSIVPLILLSVPGLAQDTEPVAAKPPLQFNRDIRPILSDNCFHCHGPDKAQRQADLRLDLKEDVFTDRDGTIPLVPGQPEKSELYRRITSHDDSEKMPPVDSGRTLTAKDIELLRRWISEGANWQPHWSLIPPASPIVPEVKNAAWPTNPIDRFLLFRMEREGLSPSPEAARTTLIRRVTLDLTGLPPTPEDVRAFDSDSKPDAYERLVDRLLSSPRYGERMAMDWLDAARYADTSGYQSDGPRDMWRWRDWVIDSFNSHQPFDQFTIEQLAGDLLPDATLSQKVATGFNRNHRGNSEGGIIPEEYACEYVVDRVETTFTVWMGLTMGCARCHDHKFDPLSQKEFYEAYAFFNNIPEFGRAIKEGNSPPYIPAPTVEQQNRLNRLDKELKDVTEISQEMQSWLSRPRRRWEQRIRTNPHANTMQWFPSEDLLAHFPLDEHCEDIVKRPAEKTRDNNAFASGDGPIDNAASFAGMGSEVGAIANFGYFDKFSFSFWIKPEKPTGTILSKMKDTARAEGYAVRLEDGKLQVNLVKRWLDDATRVETAEPIKLHDWQHIAVTYDGSRLAKGIAVYVNGEPVKMTVKLDLINQSFATEEPFRIGQGGGEGSGFHGLLDDLRIYSVCLSSEIVAILSTKETINEIIALPSAKRTASQEQKLRTYYLLHQGGDVQKLVKRRDDLRKQRAALIESFPTVMVMQENRVPNKTRILNRGQYDQPGEIVERNVPECLPPFPSGVPNNRLGFAKWLVDPEHPLTARVTVNRLWQMSFGTGLVKTTEDFGSQGERPSHPELLDWLAVELIESGWDLQHIQRLIVTSAAYRQSSKVTPALWQRDPENRLLARGPRLRLPGGIIRDQALAASGLLAERIGGPSVKPYQPAGLWTELANEKPYQHDHGENLYRKSLYTFWKRTIGPPTLLNFDASTRETCQVRPVRTNTPLQALTLMNDPIFVESARVLGELALSGKYASPGAAIADQFFRAIGREPKDHELAILEKAWLDHRKRFAADPKSAEELLSIGESPRNPKLDPLDHAAYTVIANLIMNLDEFVTRE